MSLTTTTTGFDLLFLMHCECCDGAGGYMEPCSARDYYEGYAREIECPHCGGLGFIVVDFDPDEIDVDEIEFAP